MAEPDSAKFTELFEVIRAYSEGDYSHQDKALQIIAGTYVFMFEMEEMPDARPIVDGILEQYDYVFTTLERGNLDPLSVDAVGEPAAVPDPGRKDAILVGSGRFNADDFARSWLPALPDLPREQMAEVFPLAGDAAVVLAADGRAYLTPDGGATWKRTDWSPPRSDGTEIWFDRPTGDRSGALGVVWVDARAPRPQLIVTEISLTSPEKGWQEVVRVPSEVVTDTGSRLAFEPYLRPDGRRWWLLTGCTDAPAASGLVARGPADLGTPRFLSITTP